MVVLVESGGGMRKYAWAPRQNWAKSTRKMGRWMELLQLGAGCPGQGLDVQAKGRMSGTPDVRGTRPDVRAPGSWPNEMNSTGKRATPGQNLDDLVDGNCGEDGGKLDPHVAKQIRGSNPTKLHHTNKSQKKIGAIFVGDFRI